MKLLLALLCFLPQITSASCQKEENGSLWVESYECKDGVKVTKGHELFNESIVVEQKGKISQEYLYENDKPNPDYFKAYEKID